MSEAPYYSAIICCFFEEHTIDVFHQRLTAGLQSTGESYEIVYVNDGSTDGTLERLKAIHRADPHVQCVVDLMKNFGQTAALTAGITRARGQHMVFLDSDLQFDPEELQLLHARWLTGADFVTGFRSRSRAPFWRRVASRTANAVMRRFFNQQLTDIGCTFKIVHGHLVRAFELGPTRVLNLTLVASLARQIEEVEVTHRERPSGRSGWRVLSLFDYFLTLAMSRNQRPFQGIALAMGAIAVLLLLRAALSFYIDFHIVGTVTTGMLFYTVVASAFLIVAVMSLAGEYLIRLFDVAQGRPRYVMRHVYERQAPLTEESPSARVRMTRAGTP